MTQQKPKKPLWVRALTAMIVGAVASTICARLPEDYRGACKVVAHLAPGCVETYKENRK